MLIVLDSLASGILTLKKIFLISVLACFISGDSRCLIWVMSFHSCLIICLISQYWFYVYSISPWFRDDKVCLNLAYSCIPEFPPVYGMVSSKRGNFFCKSFAYFRETDEFKISRKKRNIRIFSLKCRKFLLLQNSG